jgi:hypothetical protein
LSKHYSNLIKDSIINSDNPTSLPGKIGDFAEMRVSGLDVKKHFIIVLDV